MSCAEIEIQIPDYLEDQLTAAQRVAVETHLADCARCRSFARQLRQLDAALAAGIQAPTLPPGFDRRLQARIQALPSPWSEAQRAERKRRLQAEFEAGRARIKRGLFAWDSLREHLTWPVLAVLAGGLAGRITRSLTFHLHSQSLGGLESNLFPWLAAGAVILTVGLSGAVRRRGWFLG